MKKITCYLLSSLLIIIGLWSCSSHSMIEKNLNEKKRTVLVYHCTSPKNVEIILKEGIKSRRQLAKEGKAKVPTYEPLPGHYDNIYFQYIDPSQLTKVKPGVWKSGCNHCVAIEVDIETHIYNPELRVYSDIYPKDGHNHSYNPSLSKYKSSGVSISTFIRRTKEYEEMKRKNNEKDVIILRNPFSAEPVKCNKNVRYNDNPLWYWGWNEMTINTDIILPEKLVLHNLVVKKKEPKFVSSLCLNDLSLYLNDLKKRNRTNWNME